MATSTLGSGTLVLAGTTSGTTTVTATAVAGTTTLTLPAATDTLVGRATTDTLTNKTLTGAVMNGTLGATTPSTVAATTISASSTATFAAGAAGTPSITTTGDANTGIFFPAADTISIATAGSEIARFDSSGNLGIGTTSTGHKIEILQTATGGTAIKSVANNASFADIICEIQAARNTTNGSFTALRYYNTGAAETKFEVLDSGTVNNRTGVYGNLSDAKLKENIVDATSKLEKINQLKVRNFNFIGDSLKQIGFVAQEFEQVFPAMVQENSDIDGDGNNLGTTTKSIKTTVLIPILVKAIQEQQALITQLQADVAALKGA